MFVLQWRVKDWDKWNTCDARYKTLAEARAALNSKPCKIGYRIAEEYTVVRYKAVK